MVTKVLPLLALALGRVADIVGPQPDSVIQEPPQVVADKEEATEQLADLVKDPAPPVEYDADGTVRSTKDADTEDTSSKSKKRKRKDPPINAYGTHKPNFDKNYVSQFHQRYHMFGTLKLGNQIPDFYYKVTSTETFASSLVLHLDQNAPSPFFAQ